ncbi:MAG: hypothetical protein KDI33_02890, partial [Halioglobus sp.]|nr:hypothetical protein [Halioglobus sp.]
MKKFLLAIASVTVLVISWIPSALAADPAVKGAPIDFRACNFRDGKTMADLEPVLVKFREYANKNDFDYAAWVLTPQFHSGIDYDIGWLGAWPDGVAFGVSMEKWNSPTNPLVAEFNAVIDCSLSHGLAESRPINAQEGRPKNGIAMFYQCSLADGKSLQDAYRAHLEAGQVMKSLGSLAESWFYIPAIGGGKIDFDYYHVVAFSRYSDMGATMEM